jgi:hypothetical protein
LNGGMGTLEEILQKIHDAKIGVCITWLWDGGVDVRLFDEKGELVETIRTAPAGTCAAL